MRRARSGSIRTRLMLLVVLAVLPALAVMLYTAEAEPAPDVEGGRSAPAG